VLASSIRVHDDAQQQQEEEQSKRLKWVRDNKFVLEAMLNMPYALSHVIGTMRSSHVMSSRVTITRHRCVREVLSPVQRLFPPSSPAHTFP
jgi:hypothetical protein